MSDDGVPGTLPMGDWLFDGYPIRTDRQKHNWSKLDWSRAYIDMGPSPAGNPGPYWHVPWDCDGEELWARLYPKLVTTKWQPLVAQAIIDAKVLASREAADRIEALERERAALRDERDSLSSIVSSGIDDVAGAALDDAESALAASQAEASRLREALEVATFSPWLRDWCRAHFGKRITHRTANSALADLNRRAALSSGRRP